MSLTVQLNKYNSKGFKLGQLDSVQPAPAAREIHSPTWKR